jgi:hypothetical protein
MRAELPILAPCDVYVTETGTGVKNNEALAFHIESDSELSIRSKKSFRNMIAQSGKAEEPTRQECPIIGDAVMTENRTIIITLRRTTDCINVSGTVTYSTEDADYAAILSHLGGMNPGDRKLVPAWDEPNGKAGTPADSR